MCIAMIPVTVSVSTLDRFTVFVVQIAVDLISALLIFLDLFWTWKFCFFTDSLESLLCPIDSKWKYGMGHSYNYIQTPISNTI